ncbi:hypothetical protein [Neisseria arctica]|uniref:hypothetical protein n=1 Tax=Neisseria arctica TaxID=1470200 RepID=UPI000AADE2BC|nr:hypothetical protein [Neisseria arctica]UOO85672.1 hypothetical protein LVJ86_05365 [Neisseria arctica]
MHFNHDRRTAREEIGQWLRIVWQEVKGYLFKMVICLIILAALTYCFVTSFFVFFLWFKSSIPE